MDFVRDSLYVRLFKVLVGLKKGIDFLGDFIMKLTHITGLLEDF